jgi:hypothetical protein
VFEQERNWFISLVDQGRLAGRKWDAGKEN